MAVVKVTVDFRFQKEFRIGELESFDEATIQMVKYVDAMGIITDLIGEENSRQGTRRMKWSLTK